MISVAYYGLSLYLAVMLTFTTVQVERLRYEARADEIVRLIHRAGIQPMPPTAEELRVTGDWRTQ